MSQKNKYNVFVKKSLEIKQGYDYGCAMLYFDFKEVKSIHDLIDPKDIFTENNGKDFGLEKEPHCTLLYGLHQEVRASDIKKITDKFSYGKLDLYDISIFENEKYDVLIFNVKGENLKETNKALKSLPFSSDYPDYKPHATIAYLVKGKGKKYVEKFKNINHIAGAKHILFSHPTDKKQTIEINQTKAGFRDSQTRDAHGKWSKKPGKLEDRPCFKEWFKDSKVVDGSGNPKTFYHGTTHDFNEFNREKGNPEADFGAGFYFSNSIDDVDTNYDNIGPDLTSRIEARLDYLMYNDGDPMPEEEARAIATEELAGGENIIHEVYLSVKNPVIIGDPVYHAEEKETFFDWQEPYDEEADEYGEPTGDLTKIIDAIEFEGRHFSFMYADFDSGKVISDIQTAAMDYGGLGASQLDNLLRESEGLRYAWKDGENGSVMMSRELVRTFFERAGYDGIIDNTVWEKFGQIRKMGRPMPGIYQDTQHVIAFKSGQVKKTDAKSFCHETDIRKSGAIIIDHKAGFRETQRRDQSGKWTKDPWSEMKAYEQEIKKNDFESAGVYDKDGKLILKKRGGQYTVQFQQSQIYQMRDAVMTHNHPGMSSFSHADIRFLFSTGLTDIRAINSAGDIFSMNKAADYGDIFAKFGKNPIQMINTTFQEATVKLNNLTNQKIMTLAMKEVTGEISSLEMDNIVTKLSQEESHLIWEEVANSEFGQFALKYTKS